MGAVSVAAEMEAVALGEEVIDEETVPNAEPLTDVRMIEPDGMVDSTRGAMTSRGMIHGKLHAGSAPFSGPHWPQEGTGSIEERGLPLHRIRWPMEILLLAEKGHIDQEEREHTCVVPARNTCIRSVTNTHQQAMDQSLAPLRTRSSDP